MKAFVHRVNRVLAGFSGWLMLAMMFLLVADFTGRKMDMPLHGMAEMSVFVMMIVIYLGFAHCEEHKEHVGLEIVLGERKLASPMQREETGAGLDGELVGAEMPAGVIEDTTLCL